MTENIKDGNNSNILNDVIKTDAKEKDNESEYFLHDEEYIDGKKVTIDFNDFPGAKRLGGYGGADRDYSQDTKEDLRKEVDVDDENIIGRTADGKPIYKSDDPGEMYKPHREPKKEVENFLEQTPEKYRRYMNKSTLVERNENGKFRRGFTDNEPVVKRVLNEDGKWPVKNGLNKYMALTYVNYSFSSIKTNNTVSFTVAPGETFFAPKSGENKDKKKEMEKNNK